MDSNKLQLNADKPEALVVGTRSRTGVSCDKYQEIGDSLIPFQPKVKSLGVALDSRLTMSVIALALSFCLPRVTQNQCHPSVPHYKCDQNSYLFLSFISD